MGRRMSCSKCQFCKAVGRRLSLHLKHRGTLPGGLDSRPSGLVFRLARELAGTQQPDGGWNSLDGRASDAYSSGEALVVLHDAG